MARTMRTRCLKEEENAAASTGLCETGRVGSGFALFLPNLTGFGLLIL